MGSLKFTEIAAQVAAELGAKFTLKRELEDATSNHTAFEEAGVRVLTFHGDNTVQISPPGVDDLQWINPALLDWTVEIAVGFVQRLN